MSAQKVLDVREISKQHRKKTILNLFDQLNDGDSIVLMSDHSLAPLHKLFDRTKKGFFEWSNVQNGPETWKISIRKIESFNLTINEILKQFPFAIDVFERRAISYFQFGANKLSEVSEAADEIYADIIKTQQFLVNPLRTNHWSISFTVDYIVHNHHVYVKEMIPEIESLIDHLVEAHAATHPQLPMIRERFNQFTEELTDHMTDEEQIVFPSFKKLEKAIIEGDSINVEELDDSISWMKEDHILTGTTLRSMRSFCTNYSAPEGSSPGFKILYDELRKFETDMHFHMHLENNILFQKVLEAAEKLQSPA